MCRYVITALANFSPATKYLAESCSASSIGTVSPGLFNLEDTSVDKQFDDLFRNVIRNTVLYDFYRKRRQVLAVDDEGDAWCIDCANGRGRCSK